MSHPPIFFAIDFGSRLTLEPVARQFNTSVTDKLPQDLSIYPALIVGTSTSVFGREQELQARISARLVGVLIIVIEDYAGNCFLGVQAAIPDCIIVESGFSRRLYVRSGFPSSRVFVLPSVRYDAYRETRNVSILSRSPLRAVLWAGQPEFAIGQVALGWLAPWLARHGLRLFFKAHPRDTAYLSGAWHSWLRRRKLRWIDCTDWDWPKIWGAPIGLVATAFSSVALDAGFHGIPALHIILPRSVKKILRMQKGVTRPGVVAIGAALYSAGPLGYSRLWHDLGPANLRRVEEEFGRVYRGSAPVIEIIESYLRDIIENFQGEQAQTTSMRF